MAVDIFAVFYGTNGAQILPSESTVQSFTDPFTKTAVTKPTELSDFSDDIEQTLTAGTGAGGAGAGKVTFNPVSFTKTADVNTPTLFKDCAQGTRLGEVHILFRKATGSGTTSGIYLGYGFKQVLLKTVSWSSSAGDEAVKETVTFEFAALEIGYATQSQTGQLGQFMTQAWNVTTNSGTY